MKTFLLFWSLNYIAVSAVAIVLAVNGSYGCATTIGLVLAIGITSANYSVSNSNDKDSNQ